MQQTKVITENKEVAVALARLDVPLEALQEAVRTGYLSRITRTKNDAPNAPGFFQWNDTLRSLREKMAVQGWQRCDDEGYSTTVHPSGEWAIGVFSGDVHTGNPKTIPSNKVPKGVKTSQAVNANAQMPWIPGLEPKEVPQKPVVKRPTYMLMFHTDGHELRAELSLPITMDGSGHVSQWRERIILPALPLDTNFVIPEPDFGPDIEIKITKKG